MNVASRVPRSQASRSSLTRWGITIGSRVVDPQPAKVGDLGKLPGDFRQAAIAGRQGVAAAEDDLLDRRLGGNLLENPRPCVSGKCLNVGKMPPKTETAVDGTNPTCYDQEPALILSQEPGRANGPCFAERIGHEVRRVGHFRPPGQDLGQQRIVGLARTNPGQVRLRHEHAEGPAVERAASAANSEGRPSRRQSSTGSRIARAKGSFASPRAATERLRQGSIREKHEKFP